MREIHDQSGWTQLLDEGASLADVVVWGLDLRAHGKSLRGMVVRDAVFLGCPLQPEDLAWAVEQGALVFPRLPELPFEPWRTRLYTPEELFDVFEAGDPCLYCDTVDARIYRHFRDTGGADEPPLLEAFARRLHDHGISEALEALLEGHEQVVAFMGGHSMPRDDPRYAEVARMAARLSARGFLVATGGGPGAMEAANLGARFGAAVDELEEALPMLVGAPTYKDRDWLSAAFAVRERFAAVLDAQGHHSLGVPTFFYGHEPPNAFASHHAKYFANCAREEGLVSLATHGIIFAPGSAGTVQEVFQDACQNHYGTVRGLVSPMALFDADYWTDTLPVRPLLDALTRSGDWEDSVFVSSDPGEVVSFIETAGPRAADRASWSFCAAHCTDRPA